jgi:hypothetical protein
MPFSPGPARASMRALASSLAGAATSCAGIDPIYPVGTADTVPLD